MKEATIRQPIYLSKPKRRGKQNAHLPPKDKQQKNSIKQDLLLFQKSLNLSPTEYSTGRNYPHQPLYRQQPLVDSTNFIFNAGSPRRQSSGMLSILHISQNDCASIGLLKQRLQFSHDPSRVRSIHKTPASFKPIVLSKNSNQLSHQLVSQGNKNSSIALSNTITLSNAIDSQRYLGDAVSSQKLEDMPAIKSVSISSQQANEIKMQIVNQQRLSAIKNAYECKITDLQSLNKFLQQKITELEGKTNFQQNQKNTLLERVDFIEKEFEQLFQNHEELKIIEFTLQQMEAEKNDVQDCSIQTDLESPSSVLQVLKIQDSRNSLEYDSQDWFTRAKSYKTELQQQKIHSNNLQTEFKLTLQNKEIEWRQKYDRMQKQLEILNDKYNSKCIEVRDKQNLLNRFLQSK